MLFLGYCMSVEVHGMVGVSYRARVNFGTQCPKITQHCQVTHSDVTKLPEMSTSVYGAGPHLGLGLGPMA